MINNDLINIIIVEESTNLDESTRDSRLRSMLREGNNLVVGDVDDGLMERLRVIPRTQNLLVLSTTAMEPVLELSSVTLAASIEHISMYLLMLRGCYTPTSIPLKVRDRIDELEGFMKSPCSITSSDRRLVQNSWSNPSVDVSLMRDVRTFVGRGDIMDTLSHNFNLRTLVALWNDFVLSSDTLYSSNNPIDPSLGYPRYARMDLMSADRIIYSISGPMGADGDFMRTVVTDDSRLYTPVLSEESGVASVSLVSDRGMNLCC